MHITVRIVLKKKTVYTSRAFNACIENQVVGIINVL